CNRALHHGQCLPVHGAVSHIAFGLGLQLRRAPGRANSLVKRWQSPVSSLGRRRPPVSRSRAWARAGSTWASWSRSSSSKGWLQGWLRKKVGNAFDAADLAQSTFLKVLGAKGLDQLQEPRAY